MRRLPGSRTAGGSPYLLLKEQRARCVNVHSDPYLCNVAQKDLKLINFSALRSLPTPPAAPARKHSGHCAGLPDRHFVVYPVRPHVCPLLPGLRE